MMHRKFLLAPGTGLAARLGGAAAALALVLATGGALAQTATTPAPAAAPTTPAVPAPAPTVDAVVATINDSAVTLGEMISLRRGLPQQYQELPDEVLSAGLLEQLIDQSLLEQAARKAGIDARRDVALQLRNQLRAVLADTYLSGEVAKRVTPEAVQAAYQAQYVAVAPEDEVHAAHILVETKEKAEALKAQLDGGADFAKLAAENGTDGTASKGGDLGFFVKGDMVPQFADAAFAMKPGEISAPVESPFGWHLIKLEERRPRKAPALDEVAAQIGEELTRKAQTDILAELRAAAKLVITEPALAPDAIRADALIDPAK